MFKFFMNTLLKILILILIFFELKHLYKTTIILIYYFIVI